MTFREAAAAIGVEKYPEVLDSVAQGELLDICDLERLRMLEETYGLFGDNYGEVVQGAKALKEDPARYLWGNTVATFVFGKGITEARTVPTPMSNETPAGDMLPLLIMLPMVPDMVRAYRERGMSEENIKHYLGTFRRSMGVVKVKTGRLGMNQLYYNWTMLYVKAMIFDLGGFNFEMKQFPGGAIFLQNVETGKIVPLMCSGVFHRSGMRLGAAGFEDETGSFAAEFEETDDCYIGKEAVDGLVVNQRNTYPKAQWKCVVKKDDWMLSVHIPRKTDISDEAFDKAMDGAVEFARKNYQEYKPVCLFCSSWLLDPTLADIIGKDSKIARFGDRYVRYPNKSAGKEVFNFVFPPRVTDLTTLPENTRLERGLKKLYLEGGFVHAYSGLTRLI